MDARAPWKTTVRWARRLIVLVVGGTVLLIGIIMLVTPGPALVVIPIGLGILAIEFAWARRLLKRVRTQIQEGVKSVSRGGQSSSDDAGSRSS